MRISVSDIVPAANAADPSYHEMTKWLQLKREEGIVEGFLSEEELENMARKPKIKLTFIDEDGWHFRIWGGKNI